MLAESELRIERINKYLSVIYIILNHFSSECNTLRTVEISHICNLKKLVKVPDQDIQEAILYYEPLGLYQLSIGVLNFTTYTKETVKQVILDYLTSLLRFSIPSSTSLTETELLISSLTNEKVNLSLSGSTFTFNLSKFTSAVSIFLSKLSLSWQVTAPQMDVPWSSSDKVLLFNLESESTVLELTNLFLRLSPVETIVLMTNSNSGYVIFKNDVARVSLKTAGYLGLKDGNGNEIKVALPSGLLAFLYEKVWEERKAEISKINKQMGGNLRVGGKNKVKNKKARREVKKVTNHSKVGKKGKSKPKVVVNVDALMESFAKV